MAAASWTMAASVTTEDDLDDFSAYSHLSDDQLLQLAIERSLADTNLTPWQNRQVHAHTQPSAPNPTQQRPCNPNSANPPSENRCAKIDRNVHNHFFSNDQEKVIAWTRHNGYLRVTVETMNDLDPFLSAIWRGDVKALGDIIHLKSKNIEEPSKDGWLPLHESAYYGHVECLKMLLKGGDVNTKANDDATALFEASKNGNAEVVEMLLSKRADVNKANKTGLLPIHVAAKNGHARIVAMLISRTSKAKVRQSGISPTHLAAERNRDDVLEILIEGGYDVNAKMSDDWSKMHEDRRSTALYSAVVNRNTEAATMLLEAGADPNLDIFNPLLVAVRKASMEMVTLLVKHGANVNALLPTHPTSFPAVLVFCMRYTAMMKYLLDNGCNALSCFNCQYGSNPHPPIKTRRNGRETMYFLNDEPTDCCVEFCEIISTPSVSGWVGPIIDTLLDYVGHVNLCSRITELLDSNKDWAHIKERSILPRTLMHQCRLKIRRRLGIHRLWQIRSLPLPRRLIRFLSYERELFEEDVL